MKRKAWIFIVIAVITAGFAYLFYIEDNQSWYPTDGIAAGQPGHYKQPSIHKVGPTLDLDSDGTYDYHENNYLCCKFSRVSTGKYIIDGNMLILYDFQYGYPTTIYKIAHNRLAFDKHV